MCRGFTRTHNSTINETLYIDLTRSLPCSISRSLSLTQNKQNTNHDLIFLAALKRSGFRIMILLRLCPLIPFNAMNYICGITGVSTHDFTMSLIGILPTQVFLVIVGATAGHLAIDANSKKYNNHNQFLAWSALITFGIVFGVVAMVYTWKLVKIELQKVRFLIFFFKHRLVIHCYIFVSFLSFITKKIFFIKYSCRR